MRGYERDEYENLDEYETEGEEEEEEEDGGEYGYDEEPRQPTQDELEYLGLRERLKESFRKKRKKETGTAAPGSRTKMNNFRKDNYGSFFGPSQPVIAQRVIQESKSLLENPNLAARISKPSHAVNNKSSVSAPTKSKAQADYRPKATNKLQKNVEMRKNTRDYSFLLSEDAEVPAPAKSPLQRNVSAPKSDARSALPLPRSKQVGDNRGREAVNGHDRRRESVNGHDRLKEPVNGQDRRREPVNGYDRRRESVNGHDRRREPVNGHDRGREVNGYDRGRESNGRDVRKPTPASSQSRHKPGQEKVGPASKLPIDSRKQLGSNNGSGPGRPLGPKGSGPSKSPAPVARNTMGNKPTSSHQQSGARRPTPSHLQSSVHRASTSQGHPSLSKKPSVQRNGYQETSRPMAKQAMPSSRDQLKRPPPKPAARAMSADVRPKAKPKRPYHDEEYGDDGDDAILEIRKMFGYNPNKFRDVDDDVSDMEAGFEDIQREEKRSARIARQEDDEQLRLIEEEERRERMRLAKKRKMGH